MTIDEPFTIGVEEEYQIVHPATRELRSRAQLILPEAQAALGKQVTPELYQSQIESDLPNAGRGARQYCAPARGSDCRRGDIVSPS